MTFQSLQNMIFYDFLCIFTDSPKTTWISSFSAPGGDFLSNFIYRYSIFYVIYFYRSLSLYNPIQNSIQACRSSAWLVVGPFFFHFAFQHALQAARRRQTARKWFHAGCSWTSGADRDDWISPNMISEHSFSWQIEKQTDVPQHSSRPRPRACTCTFTSYLGCPRAPLGPRIPWGGRAKGGGGLLGGTKDFNIRGIVAKPQGAQGAPGSPWELWGTLRSTREH